MLRGDSPPRPPGRVPRLDQCSPCSACGTRRTAAGAGGQSDGLPGDPKTVDSFTSHRYLSIPPWARPCFPRLSSTSSPGHCPQFATGMGSCPLSLPRGGSAPRGPTPKRLCTRPWPSLVSGQLGHLLRVGGAPHRHRWGQARPGPRALAASSEGVSQPGHPTVRDIRLLTAECLWRTSRGQAQEAGLAVSVSGEIHFKTIQEKKNPSSITYRVAPLWACVRVTPARSVERGFLSLGFGPSCHLPRFLEMPHSHGASPRAHLISQPPAAPCDADGNGRG